ncbi:hypothetical protein BJ165DRAFT_1485954 [Panaeolus papilionaceus]|nr:hypothetical protein BJ165DRAFT_1485954 [Panaeolus papilionaceus]
MMKVRNKAAYCAYCGMPELVEAGLFSTGAPMDRCSVCKIEYYCGEEHQKLAWSYHKHFCQPFSPSKLY